MTYILFIYRFLQVYFDVTTDEVKERLINSLIPFNPKFYDVLQKSPDLYGPIWIYTTLIFVISASGSLTNWFIGNYKEDYFQQHVPIAATTVLLFVLNIDLWYWFFPAFYFNNYDEMLWV
jgi:hypothetical protein